MKELILNIHMHTRFSDGDGDYAEIVKAALKTGVDAVIVTDHNIYVRNVEGYFRTNDRQTLLLIGEEIHDQAMQPAKNHLLVLNANRELATHAGDPQLLIDQVIRCKGLSFLAHPHDPELRLIGEDDISWIAWNVQGFTGMEIWNGFSELKSVIKGKLSALFLAFFPQYVAHQPFQEVLRKWDQFLSEGRRIVAIGGSDAHALRLHAGPLHRIVYPYEFHFQAINTHILTPEPLNGELKRDKGIIYQALEQGHAFVGYDLPSPTFGFRFTAQTENQRGIMGDELKLRNGATFQIRLPEAQEVHLLRNGKRVQSWNSSTFCTYITNQPGAYRVEAYIDYLGKRRGWIFSNPIYLSA
jgi:hypothetical protein